MEKFSKIIENNSNNKNYKISVTMELIISAENEGEAGYMSDSILSSIENINNYQILNIEQTEEQLNESTKIKKS